MSTMLLHAPLILPLCADPIRDGWVQIVAGRIVSVSTTRPSTVGAHVIELPDQILLPGLINAHTHLDLSFVQQTEMPCEYVAWIEHVIALRRTSTVVQLQAGLERAVAQLLDGGTTIIGDIVGDARVFPLLSDLPLAGRSFAERIGPTAERIAERYRDWPTMFSPRWTLTATPHALHTIGPDVLAAWCRTHHGQADAPPLAMHCAESSAETELFTRGTGPLRALLDRFRFPSFPRATSPLHYLAMHGGPPRQSLLVHCNHLTHDDLPLLKHSGCTVVHCPESHAFFAHAPFDLAVLVRENIPVALGTDSLGSCASLNMLDCLRAMRQEFPTLDAQPLLHMATLHAATALRLPDITGTMAPGSWAHLCAVPLHDPHASPYEQVLATPRATFVLARSTILRR